MHLSPYLAVLAILCVSTFIGSAQERKSGNLTIYAATSLTDAIEAMRDAFVETNPEVEILLNFASSSTLAAQLMEGAPADIFASANEKQMELVVDNGRIDENGAQIFAHNQLVLIVPADNPAAIQTMQDLTNERILLVLAAEGTPIRAYTNAMLASYNAEFDEGFNERVMLNLVSEESNVRQVVTRVALGEADAGIVYQSDVIGDVADRLITIPIDDRHNQLASYPIAVLSDTPDAPLAAEFISFVHSEEAQRILADNGFCTPAILEDVLPTEATPEPTFEFTDRPEEAIADCESRQSEGG